MPQNCLRCFFSKHTCLGPIWANCINLWGLSRAYACWKSHFLPNCCLTFTILIHKGKVSFSLKKKKVVPLVSAGMRNWERFYYVFHSPSTWFTEYPLHARLVMVAFQRPWDSWREVPFPSSLYLEQLILSEYIPVPLLQNWRQHLVLYSTKPNQSANCIFTVLLILSTDIYLLFLCVWAHCARCCSKYSTWSLHKGLKQSKFQGQCQVWH